MKRKFILLLFMIFLYLSIPTNTSHAKGISSLEKTVSNGQVTLKLNEPGDTYKFIKNGQLVYKGPSNTFKSDISNIGDKYKIGIYQKNKLKKVITLNVMNDKQEKKIQLASVKNNEDSYAEKLMDDKIKNSHINVEATADNVKLSWNHLPDEDGIFEIYRDYKKIGETTNLSFIDGNVTSGKRYNYSINVSVKPSKEQQKEFLKRINKIKSVTTLSSKAKEELMDIEGSLSTIVDIPKNEEGYLNSKKSVLNELIADKKSEISTLAKLPKDNMYNFSYRTFIPFKSVADPKPEFKKTFLKGDNRGFSATSNKFRTESSVNAQFTGPTNINMFKTVSPSLRCKDAACTKVLAKKTASSSGIKLYIDSKQKSFLQWTVVHSVGIPFGSYYPKIDYSYNVGMTKGMAYISGKHDKAPNHEFYISTPKSSTSTTIYKYAVKSKNDFQELWFLKAKKSWKVELF
ncbi:DUF3238 domain-containing protein [Bacillus zhangzhouensis]|nr:DUF3238 domain-containing protein [Bacillus zhangzhouensis]